MEQKPQLLVHSRKEMWVLTILVALLVVFGFTYGLHLGKKVQKPEPPRTDLQGGTPLANAVQDASPNRQELDMDAKQVDQAAQDAAHQALKDEVSRTGLKLDKPRQMSLPQETKAEAERKTAPVAKAGKFTLQVGSYPTLEEAKSRLKELKPRGLPIWMKAVNVEGKGKHYRVYAGGFATKAQAEDAGKTYVIKDWIDSFIVVPTP